MAFKFLRMTEAVQILLGVRMNNKDLKFTLELIEAQTMRFRKKGLPNMRCHLIRDLEVIESLVKTAKKELDNRNVNLIHYVY